MKIEELRAWAARHQVVIGTAMTQPVGKSENAFGHIGKAQVDVRLSGSVSPTQCCALIRRDSAEDYSILNDYGTIPSCEENSKAAA